MKSQINLRTLMLLQFEVQDIGSAIENYYRKVFAQEQMPEIPN